MFEPLIKHFRTLVNLESTSLLVLLFVAMPMKYLAQIPEAVRIVGSIHGGLFIICVLASIFVAKREGWSLIRLPLSWIIISIPLGPVFFRKQLFGN